MAPKKIRTTVGALKRLVRESGAPGYPVLQIYRGPDDDDLSEDRTLHLFRDEAQFVAWATENVTFDFEWDGDSWGGDDDYSEDGPGVWEYYPEFFKIHVTPDVDHTKDPVNEAPKKKPRKTKLVATTVYGGDGSVGSELSDGRYLDFRELADELVDYSDWEDRAIAEDRFDDDQWTFFQQNLYLRALTAAGVTDIIDTESGDPDPFDIGTLAGMTEPVTDPELKAALDKSGPAIKLMVTGNKKPAAGGSDRTFMELKTSLEDYESQGGRVTKRVVKDAVDMQEELSAEERTELFDELAGVFLR